jgi:hypothetical protein
MRLRYMGCLHFEMSSALAFPFFLVRRFNQDRQISGKTRALRCFQMIKDPAPVGLFVTSDTFSNCRRNYSQEKDQWLGHRQKWEQPRLRSTVIPSPYPAAARHRQSPHHIHCWGRKPLAPGSSPGLLKCRHTGSCISSEANGFKSSVALQHLDRSFPRDRSPSLPEWGRQLPHILWETTVCSVSMIERTQLFTIQHIRDHQRCSLWLQRSLKFDNARFATVLHIELE